MRADALPGQGRRPVGSEQDPLRAARGIIHGLICSLALWFCLSAVWWMVRHAG